MTARRGTRSRSLALGLLAVIVWAGCGGDGRGASPTAPAPTQATVTSLILACPDAELLAGRTAQLSATATLSDGRTQNVTAQANWQSSNTAVATVSSAGGVTAVGPGVAEISASYEGVRGTCQVRVAPLVPPGPVTHTISGLVLEVPGHVPISDARIEVRDGPNAGRSASTDLGGRYSLRELVAGFMTIRASRLEYDSMDQTVVLGGDLSLDFLLRRSAPTPPPPPASPPRVVIEAPTEGTVGLTVTFRWRVDNPEPGQTYDFEIRLDKGVNACDSGIEEVFAGGSGRCVTVMLDPVRYSDQSADFAIRAIDSRGQSFCEPGRRFRVDPTLPPNAPCAQ